MPLINSIKAFSSQLLRQFHNASSSTEGWNAPSAIRHTKLAHSERVQRQWVNVASSVHQKTGKSAVAIRAANGVVRKTVTADLIRRKSRNVAVKREFLREQGYSNGRTPKGYQVDHAEALCVGGKDTPENMRLIAKSVHLQKTKADMEKLRDLKTRIEQRHTTGEQSRPTHQ